MRRKLLIFAIALQVLVLVFMAGKREFISATGTVVYLRTTPFDPQDLFRGDFVRLRYEASTVQLARVSDDIRENIKIDSYGGTVYASLAISESGLAEVTGLSTVKPASGVALKGRLSQPWWFGITAPDTAAVEYGIETYSFQEGKGLEIEKLRDTMSSTLTPLEMEIAIGGDGTAMVRGHRWNPSPISVGLEIIERPRKDEPRGRKSAKFRLKLKNTSKTPVALVNQPSFCSLSLEPVAPDSSVKAQYLPACGDFKLANNDVLVLWPDDAGFYDIDLAHQRWQVLLNNSLTETGVLPLSEQFRIIYRPPSAESTAFLKDAAIIWHGRLPSRAFHGNGNLD